MSVPSELRSGARLVAPAPMTSQDRPDSEGLRATDGAGLGARGSVAR
ncbi:hypothetical protein [Piscicoccus intestinalis]|nr:hypothetical protein [Piscicoccus intestinalis]